MFDEQDTDISGEFLAETSSGKDVHTQGYMSAGTYTVRVSSGHSRSQRYLLRLETYSGEEGLVECPGFTHAYEDTFYGCQWHLSNTGQFDGADQDIDVEAAWATTLGAGVNVAVVDGATLVTHPDLRDNIVTGRSHNFHGPAEGESHATAVAGLIAARDNGRGVRGVAPRASIHAIGLLDVGQPSDLQVAEALTLHGAVTHVSNHSYGPPDFGIPVAAAASWTSAIEQGLRTGAGGKGTSYVLAAGNGEDFDDSGLDGQANFYGVTAVCSVGIDDRRAPHSERGANLWVCAPSNGGEGRRGLLTTDAPGYDPDFGGTSGSTPIVSGVIALMRSANSALSWRDVKLILAATARKNDSSDSGWLDGALRYGSSTERYSFNHKYGFGVVDAGAAVASALTWPDTLPTLRERTGRSTVAPQAIPDSGGDTSLTSTVVMDGFVEFVEFAEINIDLTHTSFRHLDIELISPSGAVSRVARHGRACLIFLGIEIPYQAEVNGNVRLGSARHLGESGAGVWTLKVTDRVTGHSGTLKSWSLTLYGHGDTPGAPAIGSITSGATSLTIPWTAPQDIGASAVTAYDLRHIRSDAADKSDANWTTLSAIWTTGALSYELTGLDRGRSYDLQVRAVNASGAGVWSPPRRSRRSRLRPGARRSRVSGRGTAGCSSSGRRPPGTAARRSPGTTSATSEPTPGPTPIRCGPPPPAPGRRRAAPATPSAASRTT